MSNEFILECESGVNLLTYLNKLRHRDFTIYELNGESIINIESIDKLLVITDILGYSISTFPRTDLARQGLLPVLWINDTEND